MSNIERVPDSINSEENFSKQVAIANWANKLREGDSKMPLSQAITLSTEFVLAKTLKDNKSILASFSCELP